MRIACLSQSVLADDPRVRRQAEALAAAGHDVTMVGFSGGGTPPSEVPAVLVPPVSRSTTAKVGWATTILGGRLIRRSPERTFWDLPGHRAFGDAASSVAADLYIANDWRALPPAVEAAERHGGRYAFDSHEFAVEEFIERRSWRLIFPPLIDAVERRHLPGAAFTMAVGPGIARLLAERYGLDPEPTVIRNAPAYREVPDHPVGDGIRVLYHGQYLPNRGLEPLIDSVPAWPDGIVLDLRGFGPPGYEDELKARAEATGQTHRITFHGKVSMLDLVPEAASSDVGILPLQAYSKQMEHSLPNKLFEYTMAGLALVASDLPDMAEVVHEFDLGLLLEHTDAASIAAAVSSLTPAAVTAWRANARAAAKTLCWEVEQTRLTGLVDRLEPT